MKMLITVFLIFSFLTVPAIIANAGDSKPEVINAKITKNNFDFTIIVKSKSAKKIKEHFIMVVPPVGDEIFLSNPSEIRKSGNYWITKETLKLGKYAEKGWYKVQSIAVSDEKYNQSDEASAKVLNKLKFNLQHNNPVAKRPHIKALIYLGNNSSDPKICTGMNGIVYVRVLASSPKVRVDKVKYKKPCRTSCVIDKSPGHDVTFSKANYQDFKDYKISISSKEKDALWVGDYIFYPKKAGKVEWENFQVRNEGNLSSYYYEGNVYDINGKVINNKGHIKFKVKKCY